MGPGQGLHLKPWLWAAERRTWGLLGAFGTSIALAGCGGGGGGVAVEPPPAQTASGLPAPTGALEPTEPVARSLVRALENAVDQAALGIASRGLGSFTPGIDHGLAETFDCPGGGTASFQPGAPGTGAYAYSACVIEGVAYTGTGPVTMSLHNGELERFTIEQTGIVAVVNGAAHQLDAQVDCIAPGDGLGHGREAPQHIVGPLLCVGHAGGTGYGADFERVDGVISGSMQWPGGAGLWNTYARGVGAGAGSVYVAAGAGTASLRRLGTAGHEVTITANGRTEVFGVPSAE
jgi:hypothetical protein